MSEEILSLYLYLISGRKVASPSAPLTRQIAEISGKTADSIVLKTANFRSLDPLSSSKGMANVSRIDEYVWKTYGNDFTSLEEMAISVLREPGAIAEEAKLGPIDSPSSYDIPDYSSKTKVRLGQDRVRALALSNYEEKCCVCGIDHPDLLRASHIIPWSKRTSTRGDPRNVLCLCSFHDSLFDSGLIGIRDDFTIMVSEELRNFPMTLSKVSDLEGRTINLPKNSGAKPLPEYLSYHRNHVYRGLPVSNNSIP